MSRTQIALLLRFMARPIQIQLLGGLRICANGTAVEIPAHQAGALLAYLALHPKRTHTRDELAEVFWSDGDPDEARRKLRQCVYALRRLLETPPLSAGDALLSTRTTVQLNPNLVSTDVAAFEEAIASAAKSDDPGDRARFFEHAVGLYRGDLLSGFYSECFSVEQNRLAESFHGALHDLALSYEAASEYDLGIEAARRLVALNPLNEEAHCDLMRLYAAKGQPSSVVRQFSALEKALAENLCESPSAETRQLMDRLRETGQARVSDRGVGAARSQTNGSVGESSTYSLSRLGPATSVHKPTRTIALISTAAVALLLIFVGVGRFFGPSAPNSKKVKTPPGPNFFPVWKAEYAPAADETGDSEATAIKTDGRGNFYVAGFVDTEKKDVDFLTLKYNHRGEMIWSKRYNGTGNDVDRLRSVAVDGDGNVYVTGESDNGKGAGPRRLKGLDIVTIKYDPSGKQLWLDRYDDIDRGEDRPVKLVLDEQGCPYVLATVYRVRNGKESGADYLLIKYSRDGSHGIGKRIWIKRFDGADHMEDSPTDMVALRDGVAVCGSSRTQAVSGPESDYITIKYGLDGRELWRARYGEANRVDDVARFIGPSGDGGVLVIGESKGPKGSPDADRPACVTVKYGADGTLAWARSAATDEDRLAGVSAAAIAPDGSMIVAGNARKNRPIYRVVRRDAGCQLVNVYDCPAEPGADAHEPIAIAWGPHTRWLVAASYTGGKKSHPDFLVANLTTGGAFDVKAPLSASVGPNSVRCAVTGDFGWGHSVVAAGQCVDAAGKRKLVLVRYVE
jgi:DNA-binding SARP family transcriptional activator